MYSLLHFMQLVILLTTVSSDDTVARCTRSVMFKRDVKVTFIQSIYKTETLLTWLQTCGCRCLLLITSQPTGNGILSCFNP